MVGLRILTIEIQDGRFGEAWLALVSGVRLAPKEEPKWTDMW